VKPLRRATLVGVMVSAGAAAAPDVPAAGGPWRELPFEADGRVESDGVRFAWVRKRVPDFQLGPVRVFDTRPGRSFWLKAPRPGCLLHDIGGGFALWRCASPRDTVLVSLATGLGRRPMGIRRVEEMGNDYSFCGAEYEVGRHWMRVGCRYAIGPGPDAQYLNHRTGALSRAFVEASYPPAPRLDVDHPRLIRSLCRPLKWKGLIAYAPPFALQTQDGARLEVEEIRLRRCGRRRVR
jgi:hypothetical protein